MPRRAGPAHAARGERGRRGKLEGGRFVLKFFFFFLFFAAAFVLFLLPFELLLMPRDASAADALAGQEEDSGVDEVELDGGDLLRGAGEREGGKGVDRKRGRERDRVSERALKRKRNNDENKPHFFLLLLSSTFSYPVRVDGEKPRRQEVERERDRARSNLGGCAVLVVFFFLFSIVSTEEEVEKKKGNRNARNHFLTLSHFSFRSTKILTD